MSHHDVLSALRLLGTFGCHCLTLYGEVIVMLHRLTMVVSKVVTIVTIVLMVTMVVTMLVMAMVMRKWEVDMHMGSTHKDSCTEH
jgi:hypothetical protein